MILNKIAAQAIAMVLALVVALGLLLWGYNTFTEHHQAKGAAKVQALWDAQQALDIKAAETRTAELIKQRDDAVAQGNEREKTIRLLVSKSGTSAAGLRDTLTAIRTGVPQATAEALGKSVVTLTTVLADCTGKYRGMAETADLHASDAKTLNDAWPENPAPEKK